MLISQTIFGIGKGVAHNIYVKCCFLLAEVQKKQKTFFLHTSGSMSATVQGYRSHGP